MLELLDSTLWKNVNQTDNTGYLWREGEGTKIGSGVSVALICVCVFVFFSYLYN